MAELNGLDKLNSFIVRVWDEKQQKYRPIYVPPDATDKVEGDVLLTDNYDPPLDAATGNTAITPKALKMIADRIKLVTEENDGLIPQLPGDERMVFNGTGVWEEIHGQGKLYMFEVDENGDLWQLYYDEDEKDDFELTEDKDLYAVYDEDSKLLLGNLRGPAGVEGPPGPEGPKGDPGDNLKVLDSYASEEELKAAHPTGENPGDAYLVDKHYYLWNGSEWKDAGELAGAEGPQGIPGQDGDKGDQGDPGTSYYFAFEVDDNGDLILVYDDTIIKNPPHVELKDGHIWMTIDDQEIDLGNVQGKDGQSLVVLDAYDTFAELQAAHPDDNNVGDVYAAESHLYVWNGTQWKDCGEFKGGAVVDSIPNETVDSIVQSVLAEA